MNPRPLPPARCLLALALILSLLSNRPATAADDNPAARAAAYRGNTPVAANADGAIVAEAEEFHADGAGGWLARPWGENYYAATFANSFMSRKAFLGAPEECPKSEATITVNVPKAGRYLALVRYEACFRFETQFKLRVTQNGAAKLDRLYGARNNVKIWAFRGSGPGALQKEVAWSWGAVENVVWEGHDATVDLAAGPATLTLIADKQPEPAAKRNIDLVLLTPNADEVNKRIASEAYLPLDGLLTQDGDVFLRVTNRGAAPLTVTASNGTEHSPYWVHQRTWKARTIKAQAGGASEWVEVGGVLDSLNDGQWTLQAATTNGAALDYKVEIAARSAAGAIEPIASFESKAGKLDLVYDADTRYTRRIRPSGQVLYDLLDYLKQHPVPGPPPKRTIVYCYTFEPRPGDARYAAAWNDFVGQFPLTLIEPGSLTPVGTPAGYIDVRATATDKLEGELRALKTDLKSIRTVSLGDEIGLGVPGPGAATDEAFRAWAKARELKAADVVPGAGEDWTKVSYNVTPAARAANPRQFYHSRLFAFDHGIAAIKARTDIIKRVLPNADSGANFSPHGEGYLGSTHQWISLFRQGGMTMPWGEDYAWQVPIGTQQMNFLCLDLFRAGVRYRPEAVIQYYVMPHWPGNTVNQWRRQFYGDLGHGMKIINLFEFRPVQVAYTENHCSLPAMYLEVKKSLHELAKFEDIIQDGRVRKGDAALWYSQTGDVWDDSAPPFGAGKRTLYIAALHAGLRLDVVDEEDAIKVTKKEHKLLYLTDQHISRRASAIIADWVKSGGSVFATAGAGMKDEFNEPNTIMEELFGVKQTALEVDPKTTIRFEKQDLPFAEAMDTIATDGGSLYPGGMPEHATLKSLTYRIPVIAVRSRIAPHEASVLAKFTDGGAALTRNKFGNGTATYAAFLPGLSYFKPAIPRRPVDRGSTDEAMSHFIPTDFDPGAAAVMRADIGFVPLVLTSNALVEATLVESNLGVAIPLTNWSAKPVTGLRVTLTKDAKANKVELASGGKVAFEKQGDQMIFTLDLDVADAIILR